MERAFAFARVSTDEQAQGGISLGLQAEAMERYCREKGLDLARIWQVAETATSEGQRQQFQAMLAEFEASPDIRHLVFYKVDRSNRNIWDHARLAGLVLHNGKHIHAALDRFHLHPEAPPSEWDRFDMMALFARSETRHLSSRVRACLKQQADLGYWIHLAPPGYRKIKRAGIEIDPVQGPLMREILELAATGEYSLVRLAEEAGRRGIRYYRKPLTRSSIHRWVTNSVYAGPFYFKGKLVTNFQHEPLISWETHERILKRLSDHRKPEKVYHKHAHPLAGTYQCEECGRSVTITIAKKQYVYGFCGACKRAGRPYAHVPERVLESGIRDAVRAAMLPAEATQLLKGYLGEERASTTDVQQARTDALRASLAKLQQRLRRAFAALSDGAVDAETYREQTKSWREEKERIEAELASLERKEAGDPLERLLEAFELAEVLDTLWENATGEEKTKLARAVCSNLTVKGESARYHLAFPFDVLAKYRGRPEWRARRDSNPRPLASEANTLSS